MELTYNEEPKKLNYLQTFQCFYFCSAKPIRICNGKFIVKRKYISVQGKKDKQKKMRRSRVQCG